MNTFPIVRAKWSNEHIMAAVFGVSVLYLLPSWVHQPTGILGFLAILFFALAIDTIANLIRYKRPVCAVSSAVTTGIFCVLTPGLPLWGSFLGVAAGLLLGKHIWGGTGKNPVNPAIIGLLFVTLFFDVKEPNFGISLLMLPALILSLAFIKFRPAASFGFMTGIIAAMIYNQNLSMEAFIAYGAIFWSCLVLTDPVTITANPIIGAISGILIGLISVQLSGSSLILAVGIILFNAVSVFTDRVLEMPGSKSIVKTRIEKIVQYQDNTIPAYNLTQEDDVLTENHPYNPYINKEEILRRIEANGVFGFGGAAFPTIEKIKTVMDSADPQKHLIINGVECDPGLIHDNWIIRNYQKEISIGIDLLKECIRFDSITLAVKEIKDTGWLKGARAYQAPDYYPAGAEKILIKQILGKVILHNDIPSRKGILVLNVQTIYAIYKAAYKNEKATSRLITVADLKGRQGYVAKVKLGTSIQGIVEALGLKKGNIFVGGGAMQCRNAADEDIVDNNVNFIAVGDFPRYKESVICSKCGRCRANCPAGLLVDRIAELADMDKLKEAKKYFPEKCIQCGNCSRVCLAGRNLAMRVKAAKAG